MIIASGHNINPVEVENALLQHPGVTDAAAVSYADPARGDVVRAVIVRHERSQDESILAQQLKDTVAERVGRYAAPRIVALPRTEVGKLRRSVRPKTREKLARKLLSTKG
jgi:acetyl-CoA synthetase